MKKIIGIEGMNCEHCKMSIEQALRTVQGITYVKVDLTKKKATITVENCVTDKVLRAAVEAAGFTVTEITEKKGFFR